MTLRLMALVAKTVSAVLWNMNVTITELRAHLSHWLERAHSGEGIVVTDHGTPVARLTGLDSSLRLHRLTLEGVISGPTLPTKIKSAGRERPSATSSIAGIVSSQRR
jgi:prevent-host-death family protein